MASKHIMRRTTTTGVFLLVAGLSFSLVGCSASGNNNHSAAPANSQESASAASASQTPKELPIGDGIIGSDQQAKASDGSTYETLAIDPNSPILKFNNGKSMPSAMSAANYTEADGQASQKFVANYMVKEFIDSTALETKDIGFEQWLHTSGKTYYSPDVYNQIVQNPQDAGVVLGDQGSSKTIPNLVHDGKPREKSLNLSLNQVSLYSDNTYNGIQYNLDYSVTYRLSDIEAANFAVELSGNQMTAQQFLQSNKAQPSIKDGKGETTYTASGTVQIVVNKNAQGAWEIVGLRPTTNYDITSFVKG
jgi:hypothetical protein